MACTNFPSVGLVDGVTTHVVGNVTYLWIGGVWESITAPLKHSHLSEPNDVGAHDAIYSRKFTTVSEMQAYDLSTQSPVGWLFNTLFYNSSVNQTWQVVNSLSETDFGVPLTSGFFAKEISENKDVRHYGAYLDGTNSNQAFSDMLTFSKSIKMPECTAGQLYITSLPDLATIDSGDRVNFIGAGRQKTTLQVTLAPGSILFNNFKVYGKYIGFTLHEVAAAGGATTKLGKAWDSAATGCAFITWDDMRTVGFDRVGDVRQSVWCKIGTMECREYGTTPLSFVKTLKGGGAPTSGWNIFPNGWFNNALSVENYLCRTANNGPVFEGSSIDIGTLTTEGLTGDGLFIRGNNAGDKIKTFKIANLYQENITGTSLNAENVSNLEIDMWFQQGKSIGSPSAKALNAIEANITVGRTNGTDYYITGAELSSNSVLRGSVSGVFTGTSYIIDATSKRIPLGTSEHVRKYKSGTLSNGQSLTLTDAVLTTDSNYSLKIGVVYDGANFEVQSWSIWKAPNGTFQIRQNTNGSTRNILVAGSGNNLTVTNNQGALTMVLTCTVINESALAFA